jgi:hypothetical protein
VAIISSCTRPSVTNDDYNKVSGLFKKPSAEFSSAPLWVWNEVVTKEEIKCQLDDFHAKGIDQVFVHPRPGLVTEYLSPEWLELFRYSVEIGKQNGMKIWIYDENSYPSGFAGGHVPAEMPESRGRMIKMSRMEILPQDFNQAIVAIFQPGANGYIDITADSSSLKLKKGNYLVFHLVESSPNSWCAGYYYVDVMQKKVTEKFLNITLDAYKTVAGEEFGKTVPGSFQDECNLLTVSGPSSMPYTPALFENFKARWGYDLKEKLPMLFLDTLDYKTVRHNYYSILLDLFINNWAKPYYSYCSSNNLSFTGHYWEHDWPKPIASPDNMAMAAYTHIPGIDLLMNFWGNGGPGAQFGVDRSVKEVRSIANQLGKKRILSETYGASGWDISFADQKRIVDWETVLGINLVDQHLQYMTIAGARKRDHPQSFSYHEPWWDNYKVMADYISRLCVFGSAGEQLNSILVIEPTTTGWMRYSVSNHENSTFIMDSLANSFHKFVRKLEMAQVEYDLGSEHVLELYGKISGKNLSIDKRSYELVILPPFTENLNSPSLKLLSEYLAAGGKVLAYSIPVYIDGKQSDAVEKLSSEYKDNWTNASEDKPEIISLMQEPDILFRLSETEKGILYHQRRLLKNAQLLMLVNSSDNSYSSGSFELTGKSIEKWDPFSGEISNYETTTTGNKVNASFNIPPKGSLILCVKEEKSTGIAEKVIYQKTLVEPSEELKVSRTSPNVLTLDYCDLKLGNKTEKDLYFYQANLKAYQYNGFAKNPWDNGVQFKSQTLAADTLKAGTGFEATYRINLEKGVDTSGFEVVVERPSIFKVKVNDTEVEAAEGQWWLDKNFGVYKISGLVREGINKITVISSPFRVLSELESIYVLGNFNVNKSAKGFTIAPAKPLTKGSWNEQGMPFYANKVSYSNTYSINETNSSHYTVRLNRWKGTVAEVLVNGIKAGVIISEPYELDVTASIKNGENKITVDVTGSLINTLGPHHNNQATGSAWPGMFMKGNPKGYPAGSEYRFLDYGLMEDFDLLIGN